MNSILRLGVIGASITLALNLFALLVLRKPAAQLFSDNWWSTWFPSFAVWLCITVVGVGRHRFGRRQR